MWYRLRRSPRFAKRVTGANMLRVWAGRLAAWLVVPLLGALAFVPRLSAATPGQTGYAAPTASAAPSAEAPPAATAALLGPSSPWSSLSPAEQQVLAPLAGQWDSLTESSQAKWLRVARRYPALPPETRQKIQTRMTQWALLPAQRRGEARLRFQNARQLSPQERQEKWAAYQALSPEQRRELSHQAWRKQRPVLLPDSHTGPREAAQAHSQGAQRLSGRKTNLVPVDTTATPQVVAPSVVKAGPGATTSLINRPASPPLHQHNGLPKISASARFVDPNTLLPRTGPQGAGMTPVAPASPLVLLPAAEPLAPTTP